MKCYMVIFACEFMGFGFNHYATFYADTCQSLAEAICEYQEELEQTSYVIVIDKKIEEVDCEHQS